MIQAIPSISLSLLWGASSGWSRPGAQMFSNHRRAAALLLRLHFKKKHTFVEKVKKTLFSTFPFKTFVSLFF
jgi:hypothetical protein